MLPSTGGVEKRRTFNILFDKQTFWETLDRNLMDMMEETNSRKKKLVKVRVAGIVLIH
jgi:hypothetical protein